VSWRFTAASTIGTSHAAQGTPCQDAGHVEAFPLLGGGQALIAFVADGAGSASASDRGAQLVVAAATQFVLEEALIDDALFDTEFARSLLHHLRETLVVFADAQGLPPRELACTFLGLVALPTHTLVFQLGDGAIVLGDDQAMHLALQPMSGEYANATFFLSDDDALERVAIAELGPVSRLALFSDGLQRLALNAADQSPHLPFFAPFFRTLAAAGGAAQSQLDQALARFLDSPAVNERSDDDKTLVLAAREA
jgi:hypothetical protein